MNMKVNTSAARMRQLEEQRYVDTWAEDDLAPEAFDAPLKDLFQQDSGLFQELVTDYLKGDMAEFDNTAGRLARALIHHIKSRTGDWS